MTLTVIVWMLCALATPFVALLEADRKERSVVNRVLLLVAGLMFGPFALLGALFKWRDNSLVKLRRLGAVAETWASSAARERSIAGLGTRSSASLINWS